MPVADNLPKHIDDALARGLARQLFSEVTKTSIKIGAGLQVMPPGTNPKQRRRTAQRIVKHQKPLLMDALLSANADVLTLMMLRIGSLSTGQTVLAASLDVIELRGEGPPTGFPEYQDTDGGTLTTMSMHAVQRFIQRGKVRSLSDLIAAIRTAANWTAIANYFRQDGPFFIPTETGLICCDTVMPLHYRAFGGENLKGSLMKTFISLDRMTPATHRRWQRMVDAGALVSVPRATKLNLRAEDYEAAYRIMAEEGQIWADRAARMTLQKALG